MSLYTVYYNEAGSPETLIQNTAQESQDLYFNSCWSAKLPGKFRERNWRKMKENRHVYWKYQVGKMLGQKICLPPPPSLSPIFPSISLPPPNKKLFLHHWGLYLHFSQPVSVRAKYAYNFPSKLISMYQQNPSTFCMESRNLSYLVSRNSKIIQSENVN